MNISSVLNDNITISPSQVAAETGDKVSGISGWVIRNIPGGNLLSVLSIKILSIIILVIILWAITKISNKVLKIILIILVIVFILSVIVSIFL